jgi:hypothetical protein
MSPPAPGGEGVEPVMRFRSPVSILSPVDMPVGDEVAWISEPNGGHVDQGMLFVVCVRRPAS